MSVLVWIHDDSLSPRSPVFEENHVEAAYVLDEAFIDARGYGLKRLTFLAECALDLPVSIHKGRFVSVLTDLAEAKGADRILCMDTPDPWLLQVIDELKERIPVTVLDHPPFAHLEGRIDLKRFSRYWKKAQGAAFLPTAKQG